MLNPIAGVIGSTGKRMSNRLKRSFGENVFDTINIVFMILFSVIMIYPFWYVFIYSINDGRDAMMGGIWFLPRKFTLENYVFVLANKQMQSAYLITIARTVIGALTFTVVTALAGYAISKRDLPGRGFVLTYLLLPMFIGGSMVTRYIVMAKLGLLDRFLVYILPLSFSFFFMIVFRTFIYSIPASLEESAKIDGANHLQIFFKLILPLSMPVVATLLLFSGVDQWLDFSYNLLYVSKKTLMTTQYLLYSVVRNNQMSAMPESMMMKLPIAALQPKNVTPEAIQKATLMVVTLPILFAYPFLQKYFIKGMVIGAVKE